MEQAKANGVELSVYYENISTTENVIYSQDRDIEIYSPVIKSDANRIQQVLLNLQSNALKFTQKGSVKIYAKITPLLFDSEETTDNNLYLEIKVVDTGVGIPEEKMGKLFKSFGYIDDGKNLNEKGIGLGLNIS